MLASKEDGRLDAVKFSLASDIVELVVLTADDAFLKTLRDAVGGSRRLWHVPSRDQVSDLLVAGQVGILVLDVQALHETSTVFLARIKNQFPDLVVVAAGTRDAEMLLAGLISNGLVYRFIHKPMSPARAKLFADAAVRRYYEQRRRVPVAPVGSSSASAKRLFWLSVACGAGATLAVAAWMLHHASPDDSRRWHSDLVSDSPSESPLLARAATALAANRLAPPATDNALELYLQQLARNPSDAAARRGLAEVHERLLARAQNALLEERLQEAASAIETARKAGAESGRIALLMAQLARSRSRIKVPTPSQFKSAPTNDASATDISLQEALGLASERTQEGRLLEPATDSARYFVQRALQIAPDNDAVQSAEQSLAMALVTEIHLAIGRRDFVAATRLLDAARDIASPTNVANLEQLLNTARRQAPSQTDVTSVVPVAVPPSVE